MRPRVVAAITLTVAAYVAAALLWRQVFPFRDGLAEFLPEGTIAYVHVNVTPAIRRALQTQIDSLPLATDAPEKHGRVFLEQALVAPDVRELTFVWYGPEPSSHATDEKSPGPFSGTGRIALVIGQRVSAQPDVMPATTVSVGEQEIRTFVVRVQTSGRNPPLPLSFPLPSGGEGEKVMRVLRRHPVQAVLHPRELPIPALEAARHFLPETVTASGTVGRRGLVLRSDGRIPSVMRSTRTELLAEPRSGTFQIIGLPVRAIAEQLDLPFHGELRAAIEPFLPAGADLLVDGDHIVARMDAPAVLPPELVLRSIAARLWPIARPRRLDGLPASVLVADPDTFEIVQSGPSRWALRSNSGGDAQIFAERSGDSVYLATDETMIDRMRIRPEPIEGQSVRSILRPFDSVALRSGSNRLRFRTYSACRLNDRSPFIVWPIHPQAIVTASVDRSGSNVAICGRIAHPEN